MTVSGKPYSPRNPGDGTAAGIVMIPEDRKEQSLVLFAPIKDNITVSILRALSNRTLLTPKRQREAAQAAAANVRVRMQSVDQPIGSLSGGNQQRAIFGRAFATKPRLLLLDEPTRGVDVGAKAEIYGLIEKAAADGMAVLVASSELEELQLICHRIAVMNHGKIAAVLSHQNATKERIMSAAAGTAQVSAEAAEAVPTPAPTNGA
jgi:ABC-type sugar transport system ATPase subunit